MLTTGFFSERLIHFLNLMGRDVQIVVKAILAYHGKVLKQNTLTMTANHSLYPA
jgi:hypothetical protein